MSILIKNIEMPTERESFNLTIKYNGLVFDTETGIQVAEAYELSPHGRCIDADALVKSDRMVGKLMMYDGEYVYTQAEIDRAPTIIEAELPVHHGTFAATSEQEAIRRLTREDKA